MKTCWQTLPPFRDIGDNLMKKYYRARPVSSMPSAPISRNVDIVLKKRRKQLLVLKKGKKPIKKTPKRADLVYLQLSPNYCERDLTAGSLGTVGRSCNRTSPGEKIPFNFFTAFFWYSFVAFLFGFRLVIKEFTYVSVCGVL